MTSAAATTAVPLPDSVDFGEVHAGTSGTVRLTLHYWRNDPGLPERMPLKGSLAQHDFAAGDLCAVEARVYRDVAPTLAGVILPVGYFGGVDAAGRAVVLLEDLTARGAQLGDPSAPATVDEVAKGIEELAALHAQFWNPAALQEFPWLGRISDMVAIMRFLVSPDHFERCIHRAADGIDAGAHRPGYRRGGGWKRCLSPTPRCRRRWCTGIRTWATPSANATAAPDSWTGSSSAGGPYAWDVTTTSRAH